MQRHALTTLKDWLTSPSRKPLVLRGARQVGKTWLVRELAKQTQKQLIELNFEKNRSLATHFVSNDPKTILLNLESALNQTIHPEQALLFLDEIQATPELLAKLRWFYEEMPHLPVIAAGSLLEFALGQHEFSMPVGRIHYFFVGPLGFEEFLLAKDEKHLLSAIENFDFKNSFNEALHEKANQLFKEYLVIGGMPEAIATWLNTHSLNEVTQTHHDLINTYKDDFAKYTGKLSIDYLEDVLLSIPRFLTHKFMYSRVNTRANHASIKHATELLIKARVCHVVQSAYANGIPLGAEINPKVFKMILLDVGLISALLDLKLYSFKSLDEIALINQGALTEQIVGQALRLLSPAYIEPKLYYWNREASASSAEIDYLIQHNEQLIPIEVKTGAEGKLRSLHQFMHEKHWKTAVRIYAGQAQRHQIDVNLPQGHNVNYELVSLPFYLINQIFRLIGN